MLRCGGSEARGDQVGLAGGGDVGGVWADVGGVRGDGRGCGVSGNAEIDQQAIVIQTVDTDRMIAIYSYETPRFADPWRCGGSRTLSVLLLDVGVMTDQYGQRLSA